MRDDEYLHRDQDDDEPGRKAQQTEREPDRELIEADTEAQKHCAETVHLSELAEPLLFVALAGRVVVPPEPRRAVVARRLAQPREPVAQERLALPR